VVPGIVAIVAIISEQLDGFQTMPYCNPTLPFQQSRQIAKQGEASHVCSVSRCVIGTPARLHCV
jgi:hypothetical protein